MDFRKVFIGFFLVFVCAFAVYSWVNFLNVSYAPMGGGVIDTGFYSRVSYINSTAGDLGIEVGNATNTPGISTSTSEGFLSQSASTLSIIGAMIGFIPNLYLQVADYLGIPPIYSKIAGIIFIFSFGVTLAYLFLLGNSDTQV